MLKSQLDEYQYLFVKVFLISLSALLVFMLANELFAPISKHFKYSKEIYSKDNQLIAAFLSPDDKWRFETSLKEVSPYVIRTIVHKEDKYFDYHFGFNPIAIVKSMYSNVRSGAINSGASTITMQVIRMLERRDRTYLNKTLEIFRAIYLELKYSKSEILEMYLSLLPYGGNIEGVKSASYLYFDKPPIRLSLSEAVVLSIIPNNPNNLRLDKQENLSKLKTFRNTWLARLGADEVFDQTLLNDALNEGISANRHSISNYIPHLSQSFRSDEANIIHTFIDLPIQNKTAEILKRHNEKLKFLNISNCAALVIENQTGKAIAYCGSADFGDLSAKGQNDGVRALRSPGSALKPALLAAALDEGIITPKRILFDIPMDFDGYQPENFDEKFNGAVPADFALYNSLNIPAVQILKELGVRKFISLLKNCGFSNLAKKDEHLGLSMILGACGTNAIELGKFYSALAMRGQSKDIVFTHQDSINNSRTTANTVVSEAAAYLVSDMLKFKEGRFESKALQMKNQYIPKISWKTGTSYGKRDAWSVGYDAKHTVVVWCGNFDGSGSPSLIGSEIALPILFEIFEKIGVNEDRRPVPKALISKKKCKESGMSPNEYCNNIIDDYVIKNTTQINRCSLHKMRYISIDSQYYYCNSCLPINEYKQQVYLDYPPEYKLWMTLQNKYREEILHNPHCNSINYNKSLEIISPNINYTYYIERDAGQEITLQASDIDINTKVYWYLNNELIGKCKVFEKIFFEPKQEDYLIKCASEKGQSKEISIKIKYY